MASSDQLACSVCLELFQSPKTLPCLHTFCQKCLQNLATPVGTCLNCPLCRKTTPVPEGGVSEFQTNIFIEDEVQRRRKADCCDEHTDEQLNLFCVPCEAPICQTCKVNHHEDHATQPLAQVVSAAKDEIQKRQSQLTECKDVLASALLKAKKSKGALQEKKRAVEKMIRIREQRLVRMLEEECKRMREQALNSLDAVTKELDTLAQEDVSSVSVKMRKVTSLEEEAKRALESGHSQAILTLLNEMKTGKGSEEQIKKLVSDLPWHAEHPVLQFESPFSEREAVGKFIGHVVNVKSLLMTPEVTIIEPFQCSDDLLCDVHAICPMEDGSVWLAYGDPKGEGKMALYGQDWRAVRSEPIRGAVSIFRVKADWVRVEGKNFRPRLMTSKESTETGSSGVEKQYGVHSKRDARCEVFVQKAGVCELRSVKAMDREIPTTAVKRICSISCTNPVAMDVSKDEKLFAVLEEGKKHVLIFHHGYTQPVCAYTGDSPVFKPRDVCFYTVGGRERLVVADWQGDSLHVLDVTRTGCTLLGHLGGGCPLLVKPTALCPDPEGWLWVGCTGGHVLIVQDKPETDRVVTAL